jgi:hypothetical protein
MSRLVPGGLCAIVALVALIGASLVPPGPVLAASGTLSINTALHDSPDPAASVIALLPEGTIVSIDGPPVDGFYPVTTGDVSGWMRGETMQLEKDPAATDDVAEMAVDPSFEASDETDPMEVPADLDPAADPAISTTVEPAPDPAADISAATEASPLAADPANGDETVPIAEPVTADALASVNESAPMDTANPALDPTSTGDMTPVSTTLDDAVPPPDTAAPALEIAAEPAIGVNVTPIPVSEVAAVGPASVMVDAPILAGPGAEYGLMATASAGSTVEKTGHVIDGYVTVKYADITGWVALERLGTPSTRVEEPPPGEATPLIDVPPADAPPAETPLTELVPTETPTTETLPAETPTVETAPTETVPVAEASVDVAPVDAP